MHEDLARARERLHVSVVECQELRLQLRVQERETSEEKLAGAAAAEAAAEAAAAAAAAAASAASSAAAPVGCSRCQGLTAKFAELKTSFVALGGQLSSVRSELWASQQENAQLLLQIDTSHTKQASAVHLNVRLLGQLRPMVVMHTTLQSATCQFLGCVLLCMHRWRSWTTLLRSWRPSWVWCIMRWWVMSRTSPQHRPWGSAVVQAARHQGAGATSTSWARSWCDTRRACALCWLMHNNGV